MDIGSWDTVCTVSTGYVNQQLAARLGQLIQSFDYQGTDPFSGPYTISGTFGAWQLVGGSNNLLHVQVPITSGTVSSGGTSTDIGGMAAVVEVSLQLLPPSAPGDLTELTFDLSKVGSQPGDTTPGLVTPISCTDPNGTGKQTLVLDAVAAVLVANADEVSFVFATIGVTQDTPPWLTPVSSRYDYSGTVGDGTGYLAILSVTSDVDVSGFDTQIDPSLLSSQYPVTFAISASLFMRNVILPTLPSAFANTDPTTFQCDGATITNTRSFPTPGVQKGAITYDPEVTSLTITVNDDALTVATSGDCGLDMPNASMSFSVTANNALAYDAASNTLSFQPDPSPQTSHSTDIPWYDYILIGLSGGIALAVFAIVVPMIADGIANDLNSGSSGIDLTQASPRSVQWQGMQSLQVQDAGLSDLFYLRGTPAA